MHYGAYFMVEWLNLIDCIDNAIKDNVQLQTRIQQTNNLIRLLPHFILLQMTTNKRMSCE